MSTSQGADMPEEAIRPLPFHVEREIPHVVAVGRGSVIDLRIRLPERLKGSASVSAGGKSIPLHRHRAPVPLTLAGEAARIHSGLVPLDEPLASTTVELHLSCSGETVRLGRSLLIPSAWPRFPNNNRHGTFHDDGLVVVCMTTYEPDEDRLARQIHSILDQSYPKIMLIICDDASTTDTVGFIKSRFENETRITVFRNERNLGFYHNFERALSLVPPEASYVSLADQDDFWYPNKIADSIARFGPETDLVFCDAAIKTHEGETLSKTYWTARRPYFGPLDALLTLNTVTGAGAIFRRTLLDQALPFPPNLGGAFHDHWLACCALAKGGIEFLDQPLYDYIQHGHNVTGHIQSKHAGPLKGMLEDSSLALGGFLSKTAASKAYAKRESLSHVYWEWYRQLQIYTKCLEVRFPDKSLFIENARSMFLGKSPIQALKEAHRRYREAGLDTNNVEVLFARANSAAGFED